MQVVGYIFDLHQTKQWLTLATLMYLNFKTNLLRLILFFRFQRGTFAGTRQVSVHYKRTTRTYNKLLSQ